MHLLHGDITERALNAAYRVHSRLGPGLLERAYKVCLCRELDRNGLSYVFEKLLPIEYDGLTIDLGYRVDFLIEDVVVVEVKALETILPVHDAQLLSYLKLLKKEVGLLINFNVVHLRDGIRRKVNTQRFDGASRSDAVEWR